jgi:hypothetical protein
VLTRTSSFTVKVVRSALLIPLALGERAGVRETVMAAATYILWGGADAMAVREAAGERGERLWRRAAEQIRSGVHRGNLYAFPRNKSVQHFKDQIRRLTRRKALVSTREWIDQINPVIRGWGLYSCKPHVRALFHRLDGWIVHRIWSHRFKRWRNAGWKGLPERRLYGEYGLVNLVALIPSRNPR